MADLKVELMADQSVVLTVALKAAQMADLLAA